MDEKMAAAAAAAALVAEDLNSKLDRNQRVLEDVMAQVRTRSEGRRAFGFPDLGLFSFFLFCVLVWF